MAAGPLESVLRARCVAGLDMLPLEGNATYAFVPIDNAGNITLIRRNSSETDEWMRMTHRGSNVEALECDIHTKKRSNRDENNTEPTIHHAWQMGRCADDNDPWRSRYLRCRTGNLLMDSANGEQVLVSLVSDHYCIETWKCGRYKYVGLVYVDTHAAW